MNLTELKKLLSENVLAPNRGLGQNFLISEKITERIISALEITPGDSLLEIGPGPGALTEIIAQTGAPLTAVEIDAGLARYLKSRFAQSAAIKILHADFLQLKEGPFSETPFTKVISNLPYYCAAEILFSLADFSAGDLYIMIQKELAERIVSLPGSKNYGAFSVTLNFYYKPDILFPVPAEAFYPRPDVRSTFMHLSKKLPLPLSVKEIPLFHRVVKSAFWGRRKTIHRALTDSPHLDSRKGDILQALEQAGIEKGLRGERLGLDEFIRLTEALKTASKL